MSDAVIVALVGAASSTVAAVFGFIAVRRVGVLRLEINGRMTELIAAAKLESEAVGRAAGVEAERSRTT